VVVRVAEVVVVKLLQW